MVASYIKSRLKDCGMAKKGVDKEELQNIQHLHMVCRHKNMKCIHNNIHHTLDDHNDQQQHHHRIHHNDDGSDSIRDADESTQTDDEYCDDEEEEEEQITSDCDDEEIEDEGEPYIEDDENVDDDDFNITDNHLSAHADDGSANSLDKCSTTSTSSTNNNPADSKRVCDCCYCEVFGHGNSPAVPTSRNYHEMRERLRRRLSKKQEKISQLQNGSMLEEKQGDSPNDKVGGVEAVVGSTFDTGYDRVQKRGKQKNPNPVLGDSSIEEILNFINGTKQKQKAQNKKKHKTKTSNNIGNISVDNTKKTKNDSRSSSSSSGKSTNSSGTKEIKHSDKLSQANRAQNHITNPQKRSPPAPEKPRKQRPNAIINHSSNTNGQSTTSKNTSNANSKQNPHHNNLMVNSLPEKQSLKSKKDISSDRSYQALERKNPQTNKQAIISNSSTTAPHDSRQHLSQKSVNSQPMQKPTRNTSIVTSTNPKNGIKSVRHKDNQQDSCQRKQYSDKSDNSKFNSSPLDQRQQTKSDIRSNVPSNNSDIDLDININDTFDDYSLPYVRPEDVFRPSNIDLNDDELDEFERELEAFKRFCFNSKPLKDRVRVQLKDFDRLETLCIRMSDPIGLNQHAVGKIFNR